MTNTKKSKGAKGSQRSNGVSPKPTRSTRLTTRRSSIKPPSSQLQLLEQQDQIKQDRQGTRNLRRSIWAGLLESIPKEERRFGVAREERPLAPENHCGHPQQRLPHDTSSPTGRDPLADRSSPANIYAPLNTHQESFESPECYRHLPEYEGLLPDPVPLPHQNEAPDSHKNYTPNPVPGSLPPPYQNPAPGFLPHSQRILAPHTIPPPHQNPAPGSLPSSHSKPAPGSLPSSHFSPVPRSLPPPNKNPAPDSLPSSHFITAPQSLQHFHKHPALRSLQLYPSNSAPSSLQPPHLNLVPHTRPQIHPRVPPHARHSEVHGCTLNLTSVSDNTEKPPKDRQAQRFIERHKKARQLAAVAAAEAEKAARIKSGTSEFEMCQPPMGPDQDDGVRFQRGRWVSVNAKNKRSKPQNADEDKIERPHKATKTNTSVTGPKGKQKGTRPIPFIIDSDTEEEATLADQQSHDTQAIGQTPDVKEEPSDTSAENSAYQRMIADLKRKNNRIQVLESRLKKADHDRADDVRKHATEVLKKDEMLQRARALHEEYQGVIAEMGKDKEIFVKAAEEAHKKLIREVQREHESKTEEAKNIAELELAEAEREHEAHIANLREEYEQKVQELEGIVEELRDAAREPSQETGEERATPEGEHETQARNSKTKATTLAEAEEQSRAVGLEAMMMEYEKQNDALTRENTKLKKQLLKSKNPRQKPSDSAEQSPPSSSSAPQASSSARISAPSAIPGERSVEEKLANVMKVYLQVNKQHDQLFSVGRQIVGATRGMTLPAFGEFGRHIMRLEELVNVSKEGKEPGEKKGNE